MTTMAATKAALLTQLQSEAALSGVQVTFGDPGEAARRECIFLGDITTNDVSPESISSGRRRRTEDYKVQVFIECQSKARSSPQDAESRAATLATAVENSIADTPNLGGGVSGLQFTEVASMTMTTNEVPVDGPHVVVEILVRAFARLS